MSITAEIHAEYSLNGGQTWWPVASFEVGSGRRLSLALRGAGLADRGLPPNTFESLQDRYAEQYAAFPQEIFGATWLSSTELVNLMDARLWLSAEDLERVPPHAHEDYAETDTVAAGQHLPRCTRQTGTPSALSCGSHGEATTPFNLPSPAVS